MNLLAELRDKIQAVVDAENLDYDGEDGERWKACSAAGIALDDFILEHGESLLALLPDSQTAALVEKER